MHRASPETYRAEACTLWAALALLGCLVVGLAACGSDDLIFPGDIPATPTSANTATPDPDEDDEV